MRVDEKKFRCLLCDSATLFKSKLTLCHHIDGKGASSGPRCRATKEWVKRMSAVDQDIADLGVVLAQGARAAPHEYHKRQQLVMNDRQPALPHEAAYLKGVSPPPVQQARGAASAASAAAAAQVADLMARLSIAEQETAAARAAAAAAEKNAADAAVVTAGERLAQLHKDGVLTDYEFQVGKVINTWVAHGHQGKRGDPKMPLHPEFVHRKEGTWKGWSHFLGIDSTHRCFRKNAARDALEDEAWAEYCKSRDLFPDGQSVHDFLDDMYSKDPDAADQQMRGVSWWAEWKREREHEAKLADFCDRIIADAVKGDEGAMEKLTMAHERTKGSLPADDNLMTRFHKAKAAPCCASEREKPRHSVECGLDL